MMHELKLTQPYFDDVARGDKSFEVRKFDRIFKVGDYLALNEYVDGEYTGRFMIAKIKYIFQNPEMSGDYCILGIVPCNMYCSEGLYRMSIDEGRIVSSYEIYGEESDDCGK